MLNCDRIRTQALFLVEIANPGEIRFTDALPKTRSGMIICRFLRNVVAGEELVGDISTVEDLTVLDKLRQG